MKHWKLILIGILSIALIYMIKRYNQVKSDVLVSESLLEQAKRVPYEPEVPQPKIQYIEKPGGGNIAKQEAILPTNYIPQSTKDALRESYIKDTIIAALKKSNGNKDIHINSITRLLGEANKKLTKEDLVNIPENEKKGLLEWKTDFYHSLVDVEKKTNETHYNIKTDFLQITETNKGFLGFFKKKTDFMIGTSPDPSATFNGMVQSRTPIKERKDFINLSLLMGGRQFLKPYNQTVLFGGIRGTFNPDGKWQPNISGQFVLNPNTGIIMPIIQIEIAYTIFE